MSEQRLIDANALIRKFKTASPMAVDGRARQMVEDMPTIEPKKGKWIKEHWHSNNVRECSACHLTQSVTTYRGIVNFNFCPYCGADMRGD